MCGAQFYSVLCTVTRTMVFPQKTSANSAWANDNAHNLRFRNANVTDITGKSQSKHLQKSFEKNRKKEKLTGGRRRCWRWNPGQIQWFQWFDGSSNRQSLLRARPHRDHRAPVRPDGTIRCVWRLLRCRCCSIPTMHQNCPGFVVLAQRKVEKHCWSVVGVLEY